MHARAWILIIGSALVISATVKSQTPLPSPKPREPSWAFQVQEGSLEAESPDPKTIPGSTKKYTPKEIDDLNAPPDWFPDQHPPAPEAVMKGRPGMLACGGCHLMSGLGHPESADITGFTAAYFTQQMLDFRSGARNDFAARMNPFAKALSEDEIKQVAEYFASLPRRKTGRVVEAEMVPKTFVGQGRMRFVDPKQTGMEPIGNRIITLPENQEFARWRDPRPSSGFVSYVPPGSIKRGQVLAATGGPGKTITCSFCHGDGLKGLGNVPRIAGLHPIYIARQLIIFKEGLRNGPDAALMKKPVGQLTEADIIDLSAYVGSLNPE